MSPLLTIERALELIAAEIRPLAAESVPLAQTLGRILAEELVADHDLPSFANSAMDGYAFRAADTPASLTLAGESAAGSPYGSALAPGTAIAISTGAMVPNGADTVLPVEQAVLTDGCLVISAPANAGAHVRAPGGDVTAGAPLLAAGTRIGPAQIGAAAAAGASELRCHRQPQVAILSTGSELRQPGEALRPGDIFDSNGPMLQAALTGSGSVAVPIASVADTPQAHHAALARALEHDVVLTTGGVSVGVHDLVRASSEALGVQEVFWRVALRPGKPMWFGVRAPKLMFGLPGNPVSSIVCFELFVRPALLALQGAPFRAGFRPGVLAETARRNPERDDLIRVKADWTAGPPLLHPISGQQSHQIGLTAAADGVARVPAGTGDLPAHSPVAFLPFL